MEIELDLGDLWHSPFLGGTAYNICSELVEPFSKNHFALSEDAVFHGTARHRPERASRAGVHRSRSVLAKMSFDCASLRSGRKVSIISASKPILEENIDESHCCDFY